MSLVPRNSLFDFNDFFDSPWPGLRPTGSPALLSPRVDVREAEGHYVIAAELPGVKKDDIAITLRNGVLTLDAESRQEQQEEKDGKIIRQERRYGKWSRSFELGTQIHEGDITAKFEDGVLTITAPREQAASAQVKRIDIS